jgi:Fe-S cluster assembly protein SufD
MTQTAQPRNPKPADARLEAFKQFLPSATPEWLAPVRQAGIARYTELGLPTLQQEDWRFTNTEAIARLPYRRAAAAGEVPAATLEKLVFARLAGVKLVFVNGVYSPGLSRLVPLPAGVKVSSLAAALAAEPALAKTHLGHYAPPAENGFAALNQAFFVDGGFVHVPAGAVVEEPVQFIYVSTAGPAGAAVHPRNLVIAGAGSRVTILESYVALGGAAYFTNAVTEMVAGDDARVEYVKFQDEALDAFHVAEIHGQFGRTSNVTVHSFALGAKLSRNNIRTRLAGEGLECILNGLYLTKGDQLADHHMVVEHAQPHCASHEYFNGILDDKSRGVFHGRILVRELAQKTDAKQTNKNLLLSDDAGADTKPQLEIYADDVKCTHGATVGQLNDESIFYLRSRGLNTETARRMLIHAFAGEIIERVRHEGAREALDKVIWDRLEAQTHLHGN